MTGKFAKMPSFSSHASHLRPIRERKAKKIHELVHSRLPSGPLRVLDVGAGSGSIAAYFAVLQSDLTVEAIDVVDQRSDIADYRFRLYDGITFPYDAKSFDLVISNHVIEHIMGRAAQLGHLQEILRVLAPGGVAYVACPNRWQPVEPHFNLFALSWLPRGIRDDYLNIARGVERYDCDPLSAWELEGMLRAVGARFQSATLEAASLFADEKGVSARIAKMLLALCPDALLRLMRPLSPTLVYVILRA